MFDFEVSMHDKPKIEWPVLAKVFLPQSFISCEMPKQNKKTGKQDYKQIEVKKVMFDCSWVYIWHCMSY